MSRNLFDRVGEALVTAETRVDGMRYDQASYHLMRKGFEAMTKFDE
jgi:hypothetical protein